MLPTVAEIAQMILSNLHFQLRSTLSGIGEFRREMRLILHSVRICTE